MAVGRTIIALLENGQREDGSVRLPAPLVANGAPEVLPPAVLSLTTRSRRAGWSSRTTSAARGGPQEATRARSRTPKVFQGRTNAVMGSSAPAEASASAAANRAGRPASASAGTSNCITGRLTALSSATPSSVSARHDMAWTSSELSMTRNASRWLGAMSCRVSSITPRPQDRQTRAIGAGASPPREGAAQWPQNHVNSTGSTTG